MSNGFSGPIRPWDIRQSQAQGYQGWRPGNAVEAFQGPQMVRKTALLRALAVPLNPSTTPGTEGSLPQNNVEIRWTSQTFNSSSTENILQALPNRVICIVQNLSSDLPIAVNFDQTASVSGSSPNYVSQGIMLLPGVSLFIDKWCPTGTIHVAASDAPTVVTQGYSAIGNIPEYNVVQALWDLLAAVENQP